MQKYTNDTGISLTMAVWLAHDSYDNDNTLSATSLIKPLKEIILSQRIQKEIDNGDRQPQLIDVSTLAASRLGTAMHDSIEDAWINHYADALMALGHPKSVINRIRINPDPDKLKPKEIPIYLEQRTKKVVNGVEISGQFDAVMDGTVEDNKGTGTYTYVKKTNNKKYVKQGSIYRYLNPKIITKDHMKINFFFWDWKSFEYKKDMKNYPPQKVMSVPFKLAPVQQTEAFVKQRINDMIKLVDAEEAELPACTDEDLWKDQDTWKYYSAKAAVSKTRATKNYDNPHEPALRAANEGGEVVHVRGTIRACGFCPASPICQQAAGYVADGSLTL